MLDFSNLESLVDYELPYLVRHIFVHGVSPQRPHRHPEGTDSDLDKIFHICLDSQETGKTKI
jgi:hypothetical protein